jgi:putative hydrolase of the HAD superfamily
VGLISNTGRTPGSVLRVLMDKMGILDKFDVTTFSNEIQIRKPAQMAFMTTLDKLKVVPRSAVHIGDDAEKDILGAKMCGMKAIQIVAADAEQSDFADARKHSLSHITDDIAKL